MTITDPTIFDTPKPQWGPEYAEAFRQHCHHNDRVEGCPWCAASMFLPAIHDAWFTSGDADTCDLIWSMQDGYGEAGVMPDQGYDWSGIRDSEPATIAAIHAALVEAGAIK